MTTWPWQNQKGRPSIAVGGFFPVLPIETLNGKPLCQRFSIHAIQTANVDIDVRYTAGLVDVLPNTRNRVVAFTVGVELQ